MVNIKFIVNGETYAQAAGKHPPIPRVGEQVIIYDRVNERALPTTRVLNVRYIYYGANKIQVKVYTERIEDEETL